MNMTWWASVLYWFLFFVQLIQNYLASRQQYNNRVSSATSAVVSGVPHERIDTRTTFVSNYFFYWRLHQPSVSITWQPSCHLCWWYLLYCPISSPADYINSLTDWDEPEQAPHWSWQRPCTRNNAIYLCLLTPHLSHPGSRGLCMPWNASCFHMLMWLIYNCTRLNSEDDWS